MATKPKLTVTLRGTAIQCEPRSDHDVRVSFSLDKVLATQDGRDISRSILDRVSQATRKINSVRLIMPDRARDVRVHPDDRIEAEYDFCESPDSADFYYADRLTVKRPDGTKVATYYADMDKKTDCMI